MEERAYKIFPLRKVYGGFAADGLVNLKENSYPIFIENVILNRAGEYIADLFHGQRIMIVSDDNVFPLYGKQLCDSLSGYECHSLVLPHGEPTKSFDTHLIPRK